MKRWVLFGGASILLVALIALGAAWTGYGHQQTYIGYVTNAYVTVGGDKNGTSSTYMVSFAEDNGQSIVLDDSDAIFVGKTNSSDWYATLTQDMRMHRHIALTTVGVRVSLFSMYPNIIGRKVLPR